MSSNTNPESSIKYPANEHIWVRVCGKKSVLRYLITAKPVRDMYYIYELKDGEFIKLGKNTSSGKLYDQYVTSL